MVRSRCARIELDRSLKQSDRFRGAALAEETHTIAGATLGFAARRQWRLRGGRLGWGRPEGAVRTCLRKKGLEIGGRLGARDEVEGARGPSGNPEA